MKKHPALIIFLAAAISVTLAGCSAGGDDDGGDDVQTYGQILKLVASDAADTDSFGYAVAVDSNFAIVGAPAAEGGGTDRGKAYIFSRTSDSSWAEVKILRASDDSDYDYFGVAVDISGDYAVVGAGGENGTGTDQGAAYVFYRNQGGTDNWGQVKKLTAGDRADDDGFGYAASIDGDTIVIGSDGEDGAGTDRGAVYVFLQNEGGADNWGQANKITAGDGADVDQFGYSVSLDGDLAFVGAPRVNGDGTARGAVYIFSRDLGGAGVWGQVTKIVPSSPSDNSWFGNSVSVKGSLAVVGEAWNDGTGTNRGAAYLFGQDTGGTDNWGQIKKFTASDAHDEDFFGYSVAVNGSVVAVGAPWAPGGGEERGQIYVFSRDEGGTDNWGQVQRLRSSDAANQDCLGFSLDVLGLYVLGGAVGEDGAGSGRGAAYVFKKS
ncbi:MAG TPA: FG-GAP repeat protein [Candidatus Aminicenantes bacterium]|nr:FG-GAP repeat protein [Candidatus Aminicenantes bacterium]HRY66091.1 FG-GAP repeat protein [Candidatus Aminicenantes bacterium]HRZ72860.1 FG-GAP repeat protein [Candidatus Aminicenantes bacterium]